MTTPRSLKLSPERLALLNKRLSSEGKESLSGPNITRRTDLAAPLPLTPSQQQMWVAEQLVEGSSPYVITGGFRVLGEFDSKLFVSACRLLVERHESLRTVFVQHDGSPRQVVRERMEPEVIETHLEGIVDSDRMSQARDRLAQLAEKPFDLMNGPLLRVELVDFASEDTAVLLALHHIVGDLWSVGVLMRDLLTLYDDLRANRSSSLTPPALQFPDYAQWLSEDPARAEPPAELAWWKEQLQGLDATSGLITDRPRPAAASHRAGAVDLTLTPELVRDVKDLAGTLGMTPFMVYSGIFHITLARLSGRTDVAVGTPVMGRPKAELEQLIGCFMNTVTLRAQIDPHASFAEFLRGLRQVCLDAFGNQTVAFERVADVTTRERVPGQAPLFQTMITYQNAPLPRINLGEVRLEPVTSSNDLIKYDLQLDLRDDAGHVTGRLVYASDLFDAATASRIAHLYVRLLEGAVRKPAGQIADVTLLDDEGLRAVAQLGVGRTVPMLQGDSVAALFEAQVQERPIGTALVSEGQSLTFAELNARATRVAGWLSERGVRPKDIVALALPTGVDLIVSMIAVWKLSAAYLVLDMDWPDDRIAYMLEDSKTVWAITREPRTIDGFEGVWLRIDESLAADVECDLDGPSLGDIAYVMYTSGSTGRPKGVPVSHANLIAYLSAVPPTIEFGVPGATYLALQGAVTDFGNTSILTSLTTGGELHLLTREESVDPDYVGTYLREQPTDHLKIVPTHFAALAQVVGSAALMPRVGLVLGGEAASTALLQSIFSAAEKRGTEVHNHYGPTETTIGVVTCSLSEHAGDPYPPLGRPAPNVRCSIVRDGELVPPGVVGELCIAGPQVADGYLNQPELTGQRFVPDLFGDSATIMYRTGDRACWMNDGNVRFFGRDDGQVKVRGYRIELAEIEAVLEASPGVTRALTLVRQDASGVDGIHSYVTGDTDLDSGRLRERAAQRLPQHSVPDSITLLDEFPLLANGKIDRRALLEPSTVAVDLPENERRPQGPLEEAIARAFAEVLGVAEVTATRGFFELGGDSIRGIQLVSQLRREGIHVSTRDVFVHHSVAALAEVARFGEAATQVEHDLGFGFVGPTPIMNRLSERTDDINAYSHRVLIELPEEATPGIVAEALQVVLTHHRVLTGRLDTTDEWTLEVVDTPAELPTVHVYEPAADESELRGLVAKATSEATGRLDPRSGHNVEASIIREDACPPLLLLVINHLVVDGASWRIIIDDLREATESILDDRPAALEPVPVAATTWTAALNADALTDQRCAELHGWKNVVTDTTPLLAPSIYATSRDVIEESLTLGPADSEALLHQLPDQWGITAHEVLAASVGLAVRETLAQGDAASILMESESHGRLLPHMDTSRTVGWLTSVYPVRISAESPVSDASTTRACFESAVRSQRDIPFDGLGYGLLRYLAPSTREQMANWPEAQVVFNFFGASATHANGGAWLPDTRFEKELLGDDTSGPLLTRPLHINVSVRSSAEGPRTVIQLMWDAESWAPGTRADFRESLARIVAQVASFATVDRDEPAMFGPRLVQRIRPTIRSGELPLSFEQLNKVMEPVGADSTHHNVVAAVVLTPRDDAPDEQLNVDALQRALDRIRDRHEILRTSLQANGGDGHPEDWFQTVQASTPWPLTVMDLRGQPLSAAHEVVRELEETPLPVAEGTPMRTVVAALDDRKWLLVQGFHHAFVDPWGFSQFLSELTTLYNQERSGERKDLAPLPIQYGDLAAWQHHQVEAGPGREQQRYWLELFEDLPPRPIYQRLHPTTRPLASATAGFRLSEDLTERLRQAARSNGVSLFILLLASFQALQLVSTRSDDVLVTVPLMGRDEPETHQLIGYLINEVTVRTKAGHETTFAELLALVRDGLLAGQDHQVVPLRALAKTDESRWDPMRTMFNLVDFGSVQATLGGFRGQALPPEGEESLIPELAGEPSPDNLDLYLVLHQRGDELRGLWMFSNDSVDASAMADMVEQWPRLLELTTAHADITLKGLRVALSGRPAASTLEEEL